MKWFFELNPVNSVKPVKRQRYKALHPFVLFTPCQFNSPARSRGPARPRSRPGPTGTDTFGTGTASRARRSACWWRRSAISSSSLVGAGSRTGSDGIALGKQKEKEENNLLISLLKRVEKNTRKYSKEPPIGGGGGQAQWDQNCHKSINFYGDLIFRFREAQKPTVPEYLFTRRSDDNFC